MGRPQGWATEQTGRAPMRSPGRPGVNQRETKRAFWKCITNSRVLAAGGFAHGYTYTGNLLPVPG